MNGMSIGLSLKGFNVAPPGRPPPARPLLSFSAAALAAFLLAAPAVAHDWYSAKKDPVYRWSCCGGHDCARWTIRKGSIKAVPRGFHIQLTLEETQAINPYSQMPIDAVIDYGRVQPSEDGDWHLCIMNSNRSTESGGVYCLFQPPST